MHYRRSHDAVIRVYDAAGNMIEMQRARGRVQKVVIFVFCHRDLIVHFQKLLLLALRGANSPVKMRAIMRLTISLVVQVVIVIGAVTGAAGAMPSPNGKPEAQTPLATARPYLVSLSVANLDLSVRWYRDMLGRRWRRQAKKSATAPAVVTHDELYFADPEWQNISAFDLVERHLTALAEIVKQAEERFQNSESTSGSR